MLQIQGKCYLFVAIHFVMRGKYSFEMLSVIISTPIRFFSWGGKGGIKHHIMACDISKFNFICEDGVLTHLFHPQHLNNS